MAINESSELAKTRQILEKMWELESYSVAEITRILREEKREAEARNSEILDESRKENLKIYDMMEEIAGEINESGQNSLFQFTNNLSDSFSGIGDSLKNTIPEEVKEGFGKISSTMGSHVNSIMGPSLNSLFGDVQNLLTGAKDIFVGGFRKISGFFGMGSEDDKMSKFETKVLRYLNAFDNRQENEENARKSIVSGADTPDEGGLLMPLVLAGAFVGLIAGSIIALVGGIGKAILIPFQVTLNAFLWLGVEARKFFDLLKMSVALAFESRLLAPFKWLAQYFSGFMVMLRESTFIKAISGFFTSIKNFGLGVMNLGRSIGAFLTKIPILGSLFSGFARGFSVALKGIPVIGWFITGVLGIIDFFKGFMATQGEFYDKLKGGLTSMLTGFFDPVFELVGWLVDKFLGIFGINSDSATFLKDTFKNLIDSFFGALDFLGNTLKDVWNVLGAGFIWLKDKAISVIGSFTSIWDIIKAATSPIIDSLTVSINNIGTFFNEIWNWFLEKFNWLSDVFTGFFNWMSGDKDTAVIGSFITKIQTLMSTLGQAISDWLLENIPGASKLLDGYESAKNWVASIFGKGKEAPPEVTDPKVKPTLIKQANDKLKKDSSPAPEVIRSADNTQKMEGELEYQKIVAMTQNTDEMKRLSAQNQANANMAAANVQNVNNNNAMVNANVSNRRGGSQEFREIPDEIENFGMIFFNKSTLGSML